MPYNSTGSSSSQIQAILGTYLIVVAIIGLISVILALIIWWKIFSKAGYSGALSLLMFVPLANFILLLVLAFGQWPIHRELEALRQQAMRAPQFPSGPQYPQNPSGPQYPQYPQGPQYPQYRS